MEQEDGLRRRHQDCVAGRERKESNAETLSRRCESPIGSNERNYILMTAATSLV